MASEVVAAWNGYVWFLRDIVLYSWWSTSNNIFQIIAIVCAGITLHCFIVLLYKNISFVMMKRLFKEPNVIIIMVLSLCNWAIDIGRPLTRFHQSMVLYICWL